MTARHVVFLASMLAPLWLGGGARAQEDDSLDEELVVDRQVAVLPLAGSRTQSVQASVEDALQAVAIVVPLQDVKDSADRLGLSLRSDEALGELAKELLVDIFIRGSVRGRRAKNITLTFLDKFGEEISRSSYRGPVGRKGRRRFRTFVEGAYRDAQQSLQAIEDGTDVEPEEYEEVDPIGIRDEVVEEDLTRNTLPLVSVQGFVGARTRDTLVRLRNGFTRTYNARFFTDLGIRLHARPYGNKLRSIQGVFVDAEFAIAPFVRSVDDFGGTFESSALRLHADVGYRLRSGRLEIGPAIGLGVDSFSIEEVGTENGTLQVQNLVLPSATYWFVRAGAVAEFAIKERLLSVQAIGGIRYALGVGDLVPIFGADASAFGFDASLVLSGALDMGLTYAAFVRYAGYNLSFSGQASNEVENGSDGHDRAVYLGLGVGYEFYDN